MKKVILTILSIIAIITVAAAILWKIPFYTRLKSINTPAGCEEITTKVKFSDVYRLHIIGDRVIKYNGGLDKLEDYVRQNNSDAKLKYIDVHPFFSDWDDCAVFSNYYDDVEESCRDKYMVIRYYYAFDE